MSKYVKKIAVIEAFRWTGTVSQNEDPEWFYQAIADNKIWFNAKGTKRVTLGIETLEGNRIVNQGDFIVKGNKGEFYSYSPNIFQATYEAL